MCQVKTTKDEKEVTCGKELRGVYSSNIKKHLKMHHKAAFQTFKQEEGERKYCRVFNEKGHYSCFTITVIEKVFVPELETGMEQ